MDGLIASMARPQEGSPGSPGVFAGCALLATVTRDGACREASRGVKGLVGGFLPRVLGAKGGLSKPGKGAEPGGSGGGAKAAALGEQETSNPPLVLKMRSQAPPSFWEPESPLLQDSSQHSRRSDEIVVEPGTGEWGTEFLRHADWDWAASERLRDPRGRPDSPLVNNRFRGARSGSKELKNGVPIGPAGEGPVKANPGRPDWHRMLVGESKGSPSLSGTGSDSDSVSEYPDELTKVTEDDVRRSQQVSRNHALGVRSAMANRTLSYGEYLHLDKVLGAQAPQSSIFNKEVHDEMLFIIIHQTYELWFKQIMHELDSIIAIFQRALRDGWGEKDMGLCEERAGRISQILRVLVHQFDVLETMRPQGFHDFRDFLNPASGFQSVQFRKLENKLGLREDQRIQHSGCPYYAHLKHEEERTEVLETEKEENLSTLLGSWLSKLLESVCPSFDFAHYMRTAIEQAAEHDKEAIMHYPRNRANQGQDQKDSMLEDLEKKRAAHLKLFDREAHSELVSKGIRQFNFEATMACVFVQSFANELVLQGPQRFITHLVEIDELLARWRQRHSLLVMRMIGSKSGTGGSSGHAYLNAVLAKSRIFTDLCHSSHYLLPVHSMPPLPRSATGSRAP